MNEILLDVRGTLKSLGYAKRRKAAFEKTGDGFVRLIDFQEGCYGGGYFFINLCVHPIGLPQLLSGRLVVREHPKEYECILRQRLEQVVDSGRGPLGIFRSDDVGITQWLRDALQNKAIPWLDGWCSWRRLSNAATAEVSPMLTVVPRLRPKALHMLRCFSLLRLGDVDGAAESLREFRSLQFVGFDFSDVDRYLEDLLSTSAALAGD